MNDKFSVAEVAALRNELSIGGLDKFQVAELLKMFIMGRGYGVSVEDSIRVAGEIERAHPNMSILHENLERIAFAM